ncbi:transmembrane protein 43 homolog [Macrosteles quadrilineatus]|uniref:transmembrane protein 43 homolog n=1 Tax=Macrosteles quadrilineatus TaxID=74068 RepID=UPI0023E2DC89|nr:transmembrane protein 43 homolog [Macrosteles quadrilineatus]
MFQWVEVQEEKSQWWGYDTDSYNPIVYTTAWRDRLVDSTLFAKPFGHANPKTFPLESSVSVSEIVHVGGYTLSDELKDHFTTYTLLTSDQRPERRDIKMHSGLYYHSFDVWNPEVGDTRVQLSYTGASDSMITILAEQDGSTLRPFVAAGEDLTVVVEGELPLSDILAIKFPSSGVWLIRISVYFGIYCGYSTLSFIVGRQSRLLQAFVHNNKAFLCQILSAATFFTVMAFAWLPFRPVLGSVNLLIAAILVLYLVIKGYSLYYYFNR